MSLADCLRLLVLFFWLLAGNVNCENTQKGQVPMGVHNDNREHKSWRETLIYRIPTAREKTPSDNLYPAQEAHTTDSISSQVQSHYSYPVIPEIQRSNVPKSQVSHSKSGFFLPSITRQQSNVVYHRSGNKALPDDKTTQQENSDSVFSAGAVLVPPPSYFARPQAVRGFQPQQVDRRPIGFGSSKRRFLIDSLSNKVRPNIQDIKSGLKSESQKIHVNPSRTSLHHQELPVLTRSHGRANINKKTDFTLNEKSPGSNSAGKVPTWSPRVYSSDVMSEARGYAHVRRLKPGFNKTRPHPSCTVDDKFLETGFPPVKQNQGSRRGPGPPPTPQSFPVQGKFKPFQRLPSNDLYLAHTNSSESEMAPNQTFSGTTLPPGVNSTAITTQPESSAEIVSSLEQNTTVSTSTTSTPN